VIFHLTLKIGKNGIGDHLYLFVAAVFAVTDPYLKTLACVNKLVLDLEVKD